MSSYHTIYQTVPTNYYHSNTLNTHLSPPLLPVASTSVIPVPWRTHSGELWLRETIFTDTAHVSEYREAVQKDMAHLNARYYQMNSMNKLHSFHAKMNEQKESDRIIVKKERDEKFQAWSAAAKLLASKNRPPTNSSTGSSASSPSKFAASPRVSTAVSFLPIQKDKKRVTWSPEIERTHSPDRLFERSPHSGQEVSPDSSIDVKFDISDDSDSQSEENDSDVEMSNSSSTSSSLLVDSVYPSHYEARVAVSKYFHSTSHKYTIIQNSTQNHAGVSTHEVLSCHLSKRALKKVVNQRSKIQRDYVLSEEKKYGVDKYKGCNFSIKIIPCDLMNSDGAWKILEISGEHDHEECEVGSWMEPRSLAKRCINKGKGGTVIEEDEIVECSPSPVPQKKRKHGSTQVSTSISPPPQVSRLSTSISNSTPTTLNTPAPSPPSTFPQNTSISNPTPSRLLTPKELTQFLFSLDKSLIFNSMALYEAGLRSLESLVSFIAMDEIDRDLLLKELGIANDGRKVLGRLK